MMQKENIVECDSFHTDADAEGKHSIAEDLTTAIQKLIHRLREQGPLA